MSQWLQTARSSRPHRRGWSQQHQPSAPFSATVVAAGAATVAAGAAATVAAAVASARIVVVAGNWVWAETVRFD